MSCPGGSNPPPFKHTGTRPALCPNRPQPRNRAGQRAGNRATAGIRIRIRPTWFRQLDLALLMVLLWPHLKACDLFFRVGLGGRSLKGDWSQGQHGAALRTWSSGVKGAIRVYAPRDGRYARRASASGLCWNQARPRTGFGCCPGNRVLRTPPVWSPPPVGLRCGHPRLASDLQSLLEGSLLNFAEKDVDCLFPRPQPLFAFRHRSPTQLRLIPLLACHALPPFRAMVPRKR